jgi:Domain of unknown function (DUF4270)
MILLDSCRKPEDGLGLELLPDGTVLGTVEFDTLSLSAFAKAEPPRNTRNFSRGNVGSYVDAYFGKVQASLVTQVRLSGVNIGQDQADHTLVPDSLVLSLAYPALEQGYGNLGPQTFSVKELAEDLFVDSTYYSDRLPKVIDRELIQYKGQRQTPRLFDPVYVGDDTLGPQLRLPLNLALAQRFLDVFGAPELASNTNFLPFFKGLWVTTDNGYQGLFEGGVLGIDLLSTNTQLTLYYTDISPEDTTQKELEFLINSDCVRYNVCLHDVTVAQYPGLAAQLADSTVGAERTYVQSLGGVRTVIYLPGLDALPAAQLDALAKAELVVPVAEDPGGAFPPPGSLIALRKNDEGEDVALPDQLNSTIGGLYDAETMEYRLNITQYVQGVLIGTFKNTGLSLVPAFPGSTVNRAVLAGSVGGTKRLYLRLTFTTY